jgi:hypothetical protein
MMMVLNLAPRLPRGFAAEPRVHLSPYFEIDVWTFDKHGNRDWHSDPHSVRHGGAATAILAPPAPNLTVDVDFPDQYVYEVLIFDQSRDRRLVAAAEIVSPANKDRTESRQLFITRCANLLRNDVCVSLVDLITVRRFNLYTELLSLLGQTDPSMSPDPPPGGTGRIVRAAKGVEDTFRSDVTHQARDWSLSVSDAASAGSIGGSPYGPGSVGSWLRRAPGVSATS